MSEDTVWPIPPAIQEEMARAMEREIDREVFYGEKAKTCECYDIEFNTVKCRCGCGDTYVL